jgi:hypothetical protein
MVNLRKIPLARSLAALAFLSAVSCAEEPLAPWNEGENQRIKDQLAEVAEAYAILDVCIPWLEADSEAKHELIDTIKADRYAKLTSINTDKEREKIFRFYEMRGGTPDQNIAFRETYEAAYETAVLDITSTSVCVNTIKDFANTIINMRILQSR